MTEKDDIPSFPVFRPGSDPLLEELFIDFEKAAMHREKQAAEDLRNRHRAILVCEAALAFPTTMPHECREEVIAKHKLPLKPRGWINRIKRVE